MGKKPELSYPKSSPTLDGMMAQIVHGGWAWAIDSVLLSTPEDEGLRVEESGSTPAEASVSVQVLTCFHAEQPARRYY